MPKPLSSNDQLVEQEDAVGMYLSALLIDDEKENTNNAFDKNSDITPQENALEFQDESLNSIDEELSITHDASKD